MISVSDIKTKIRQITYRLKRDFLAVENIVLIIAIILCLLWTYQSITAMSRNWTLSERLSTEKKSLELLEVEIDTLELENAYYQTEEYQELAARRLAGKQLPGEKMVYLPANSEVAKTKHQPIATKTNEKTYSNVDKWIHFLFPDKF